MYFISMSDKCYFIEDKARAERMFSAIGYKKITEREFYFWCKKKNCNPEDFTIHS